MTTNPISARVRSMLRKHEYAAAMQHLESLALTPQNHHDFLNAIRLLIGATEQAQAYLDEKAAEASAARRAKSRAKRLRTGEVVEPAWASEITFAQMEVTALRKANTYFPIHLQIRKYLRADQLDLAARYLQHVEFKDANADDYLKAVGSFRRYFAKLVNRRIEEAEKAKAERLRTYPNRAPVPEPALDDIQRAINAFYDRKKE